CPLPPLLAAELVALESIIQDLRQSSWLFTMTEYGLANPKYHTQGMTEVIISSNTALHRLCTGDPKPENQAAGRPIVRGLSWFCGVGGYRTRQYREVPTRPLVSKLQRCGMAQERVGSTHVSPLE